jgi:hypothetical protein
MLLCTRGYGKIYAKIEYNYNYLSMIKQLNEVQQQRRMAHGKRLTVHGSTRTAQGKGLQARLEAKILMGHRYTQIHTDQKIIFLS